LTRYFAVLGGVVLILVGLAFGLRKLFHQSALGGRNGRRSMQVVEVLSLGSRRQLAIVRCFDRTFALGLGEKSVSLVAELDAEMVQHEAAKAAAQPDSLIPRKASLRKAKAKAPAVAVGPDPFETLLEQAQAQLEARRRAEAAQTARSPQPQAQGLQELG